MSTGRAWTEGEIDALGVRCSVADAASIIGLGKHKAYRMLRDGRFPLPWYTVDGRVWVPTRPIKELLYLKDSTPGARSRSCCTSRTPPRVPLSPEVETARAIPPRSPSPPYR